MRPARVIALTSLVLAIPAGSEAATAAGPPVQRGAQRAAAVHHDVSPPLRTIPPASPAGGHAYPAKPLPAGATQGGGKASEVLQNRFGPSQAPTLGLGILGLGNGFTGPNGTFTVNSAPPDNAGAVGPNDYVQMVNQSIAVFDKSGNVIYGPVASKTLWSGFGGLCQSDNDGDGTVEYDRAANRWIVSQFAVTGADGSNTPYLQCVAVSQTGDPTGAYSRYSFSYSQFPDYPKLSVWPDAYYATFNLYGANGNSFTGGLACAYDRSKMLAGQAATQQCFNTTRGSLLPSDLDGPTAPPSGSPNYMVALHDSTDIAYWKFHVDWTTPANSTFTGPTDLAVDSYSEACGGDSNCIPQSGTSTTLDSLGDRLMYRLAYRNFGDHQALVVNHSIVADTSVGIRWYELRVGTGNTLSVFQQGTFAPDTAYRWMGSAAMDKNGDIALGYSTSSSSTHPSIRYTARLDGDLAGQMTQGEGTVFTGSGSQTTFQGNKPLTRWGDYSTLTVDPSGDCRFWYVNEYLPADGSFNWATRIGTFNVAGCSATTSPPAAPTNVAATASDGSVSLTWNASTGATGYKVFLGTSPGGEGTTEIATPSGTSFTDTGRTNGTTYYYTVAATNGGDDSSPSSEVHATPVATPTGLSATAGNASASLSWSPSAGATGYRVYRGTSPGGEGSSPVGTPSGASFNDTGLTNGNTYYYKVDATNSTGASPKSSEASTTLAPPAPSGLTATASDGSVSLSWSAANGAASYRVYRGTSSNGENATAIASPTGTSFTDTARTNGQPYYYKVAAVNAGGTGPMSSEANATPLATPTGLSVTGGSASASLSWSSSTGATGYRVYRGTSPGGEASTPVGSPSVTTFNDTGLTNGNTYYYKVDATNSSGASPKSSEASTTLAPPAPGGLSATAGNNSVSLSWSAANGATSYKVYRGTSSGGENTSTPIGTPTGASFTDTTALNGTQYFYKVTATNAGGDSPLSSEANATPHTSTPAPPSPPGSLSATAGDGSVSLTWSASSGATSYSVYRGTSAGGEGGTPVANPTGTSFNDTGLTNGTTYYYEVTAHGSGGESNRSTEVSATPQSSQKPPPPQQPPPTSSTSTSTPPIPLPQGIVPAADTTPPTLTLAAAGGQKLKNVLKKGVAVNLGCSEACTISVSLLLDFKTAHSLHIAKSPVKIGAKSVTLTTAGKVTVRVPFSSKARKHLRGVKKLKLTIQIVGKDNAGNKTMVSSKLSLR